uniref:Uncharacterized protein n=1 Tax=viral metagenome TaxID=1070528 RepID=A0A6C0CXJ7_9ZZZZ
MATHGDIERTIEIINTRTDDINILLNHWNENQNNDRYRQDFNNHTNDILRIFEQFVDIINRTPDNRYLRLSTHLYHNLEWLLGNIYNMLGDPNDVNDSRHQLRSEIGLLDKTQRMTNMMNILDAYIIRHSPREVILPPPPPSSGGTRKYKKSKKTRKTRKSKKSRKAKKSVK